MSSAATAFQSAPPPNPREGGARAKSLPLHLSSHARAASVWSGALSDAGDSARAVGRTLGISSGRIAAWALPHEKRSPGLHRLIEIGDQRPTVAKAILRRLDAQIASVETERTLLEHVARVTAEVGDLAREGMVAAADGRVDEEERLRLLREAFEARRAIDDLVVQLSEAG